MLSAGYIHTGAESARRSPAWAMVHVAHSGMDRSNGRVTWVGEAQVMARSAGDACEEGIWGRDKTGGGAGAIERAHWSSMALRAALALCA